MTLSRYESGCFEGIFFLMQHDNLHYNTKIQYSAATVDTTYNGALTRLRYKYVYHLQYIGIFTIRF